MLSTNASAPLVALIGATGQQGGSVVKWLLESDKPYRFRALSRNVTSEAAKALAAKGVEVVSGNATNSEDVFKLFVQSAYIFINLPAYLPEVPLVDTGKALVNAAREVEALKLFIWSGAKHASAISDGKLTKVIHFDEKAEVAAYGRRSGIPFCAVDSAMFMQNFATHMAPRKEADGSFAITSIISPKSVYSLIDVTEYGLFVQEAIEQPQVGGAGSALVAAGEEITIENMMKVWGEVTGQKGVYIQKPRSDAPTVFPWKTENFAQMFEFIERHGFFGGADPEPSRQHLAKKATTWREFCEKVDWSDVVAA